ncbi:MAG: insulinase family protein [Deltaproteobacteria bacterium]|nr:insulinase family protein [Deltaproteobacteria bacterium]MBI4795552.1 insulinase family protein [Deltaproteobacteria bacterium]
MHQKSVLNNGLRVVTEEDPHFHSVAVGVWLNVGSRDEAREENGLSHFLEHLAFKGTPRRSALDIAREIDQLGGSCNAFTSKENTCYHGKVLAENLPRAVDLLSDLVLNPGYQPEDLEKERQVILEEICAQDDNPEDQVQVQFTRGFWGDAPFGRPILGEGDHISRVTREQLLAYRKIAYRPETTIVAAAGRVQHQEVLDLVASRFEHFHNGSPLRTRGPVATHPGIYRVSRDLEQVHVCLGTKGPAAGDEERFVATLLQLLLGGNMSSRLFQVVREELGLAYNIYAFMSFFSDTGLLGVSAGVSPKNLERLLDATYRELKKMKAEAVSEEELKAAKEYLRGSIYLHAEDCDHRMMRLAKNEINFGHYIPLEEIVTGLLQVTAAEIQDLAQELLQPENWALALLGPVAGEMGVDF